MRHNKKPVRRSSRRAGLRDLSALRAERYKEGTQQGYAQGMQAGFASYDALFDGTSIILPVHNEREVVRSCIEAIMDMTNLPYEIIVVDNGSQDGIEHDLKKLEGQVRYRLLHEDYGYAGAVNRGLMMAKGTTILIMSCHLLPTERWLENMLACLEQNSRVGLVGPVSCGLSGEQQVVLKYGDMDEMLEAARLHSESRNGLKQQVTMLSKSCLLMRNEVMQRVGYLDEGCESADLQVADYGHRCMLQGYSLVCAKDAYLHVNTNLNVDRAREPSMADGAMKQAPSMKWKEPSAAFIKRISQAMHSPVEGEKLGERRFYPEKVAVQGLSGTLYWIEEGFRRPIVGVWNKPVIRLSQLDLWSWPIGKPVHSDAAIQTGKVHQTVDGSVYYLENGSKRPIINAYAQAAWCLPEKEYVILTNDELDMMRTGEPIIAPVQLRQSL